MKVEFIFDADCPNIKKARKNLMKAFSQMGISAKWTEWERGDENAPKYVKQFGSPTILVNGEDIEGQSLNSEGNSCRFYDGDGVPSIEMISSKLKNVNINKQSNQPKWITVFGTLSIGPGVGAAILAKATCPFCYPAIAGFLSSIGLGFIFKGTYFLIAMGIFFAISLFGLWYKSVNRRGLSPFWFGLIGSLVSLLGKYYDQDIIFYTGIGFLVGASVWNLIPKKEECSTCINVNNEVVYEKN